MTENFGQVASFKRGYGEALFVACPEYRGLLSRLEGEPAGRAEAGDIYIAKQRHGEGRYATFMITEAREGVLRVHVDTVGISPERALGYFGAAVNGRRIAPTRVPSGTRAKFTVLPDYIDRIRAGVLSGLTIEEGQTERTYSYAQVFGNLHARNRRDVRVTTTLIGTDEIFWRGRADNHNDEMLARKDFKDKLAVTKSEKGKGADYHV